jgi:DNA-binding NarL/FixJ family response regulator
MSDRSSLSVLVIDDVQLVVDGVVTMLRNHPAQVRIAGTQIGALQPCVADVALVDAFGHPGAGVDRIAEVTALGTVGRVVLYTWKVTPAQAVKTIASGAAGILSKSNTADQLVADIQRVAAGEIIVNDFPFHVHTPTWLDTLETRLTGREIELLAHVANGLSNAEIGNAMYLAESSVKTYLKRVYRKLGIHSRAQAVMRAVELGIAGPDAGPNVGMKVTSAKVA